MIKFGLIGAAALSLALAVPAMAQRADAQHGKSYARNVPPRAIANGTNDPNLPVQDALRWGYSQGYEYYPSGFGGLYGDGRYPGNTVSNKNYPTWW